MVNNLNDNNKYIDMEVFGGKWFFDDDKLIVSNEDMKYIKPLAKEYSSLLWKQNINNHKRHFALLSNDEKLVFMLEKLDCNWHIYWNNFWNNGSYEEFSDYLKNIISYNSDDIIIVFWSENCAVETRWQIFLKHWANFLFDDESVVLMNMVDENILLFTPEGILRKGKRLLSNDIL